MKYNLIQAVEFDKYAVKSYNAIYDTDVKQTDIRTVERLQKCDLLTYGFPCGLAGTQIITKNGYKNIEDVINGDFVLTHNNKFNEVIRTMSRLSNCYYKINGIGICELYLTEEHPLYVLRSNEKQWIKVKDLLLTDKITFNINLENIDCEYNEDILWLLGRYVADGYINKYTYNSVYFAIGKNKEKHFLDHIPKEYIDILKKRERSCVEYRIADKQLKNLCLQFNNGATNKEIPQWIIDLPTHKLHAFFNGYISGDGHIRERSNNKEIMFTTVSKRLFLGMQQIIAKLYGRICSCSIRIDNRKKTFNNTYNGQVTITQNKFNQQKIDNQIFTSIKKIEKIYKNVDVYNFEVNNDNSYTCNNIIVHNCQDISMAGKMQGINENTRSGLLYEVYRLLCNAEYKPKFLIMENVKNLVGKKFKQDFDKFLLLLEDLGYYNYWKVLNSKDYGIPQNRERVFCISIRKDIDCGFEFPIKKELGLRLKDILEDVVDEKFYLNDVQLNNMINSNFNQRQKHLQLKEICDTLMVRDYKEPACMQVGNVSSEKYDKMLDSSTRVYSTQGISPTLHTCGGGNIEAKILEDNNFRIYDEQNHRIKADQTCIGTLLTQNCDNYGNRLIKNQRIRKLTPLEYWRLQGFDDESFYKAQAVNSNSQLYKQSGNSITVAVLVEIYKQLKKYYPNDFIENIDIITLFSGIGAFEAAFNKL